MNPREVGYTWIKDVKATTEVAVTKIYDKVVQTVDWLSCMSNSYHPGTSIRQRSHRRYSLTSLFAGFAR